MECSDLSRTGVAGLDGHFIINIDHHAGNRMYGALNWFDESAAACGEMVFDVIRALGVPLSREIATHIYLAILTDTGSFHHSNITPRTFDICRQAVEAGVNPAAMARRVFDSNSFGKLKLIGALLDAMELIDDGRLAVLYLDDDDAGGVRLHAQRHRGRHQPAADRARDPGGGVLQGRTPTGDVRVSMRSKYDVDVRAVANALRRRRPQERRRLHRHRAALRRASRPADHRAASSAAIGEASERAVAASNFTSTFSTQHFMNGVLVVDKPAGPTSHDVVAVVRRALGSPTRRPHRHARSAGDRRAAAGHRPGHAAGVAS